MLRWRCMLGPRGPVLEEVCLRGLAQVHLDHHCLSSILAIVTQSLCYIELVNLCFSLLFRLFRVVLSVVVFLFRVVRRAGLAEPTLPPQISGRGRADVSALGWGESAKQMLVIEVAVCAPTQEHALLDAGRAHEVERGKLASSVAKFCASSAAHHWEAFVVETGGRLTKGAHNLLRALALMTSQRGSGHC